MAATTSAILLSSPLSSQSLTLSTTTTTTRKNLSISKPTSTKFSPLPRSISTQLSVQVNLWQRRRFPLVIVVVDCLPSSSSSSSSSSAAAAANKRSTPLSTKLFVSGLSFRTTEESLRTAFQNFGQLTEVNLVMDRIANRPRGFAFLRYATMEESQRAIEGMHGKFLDGRVIFVEVAKPRSVLRQGSKQTTKQY